MRFNNYRQGSGLWSDYYVVTNDDDDNDNIEES